MKSRRTPPERTGAAVSNGEARALRHALVCSPSFRPAIVVGSESSETTRMS